MKIKGLCIALLLLTSNFMWSQSATDGAIVGSVADSSGAVVQGAVVTTRDVATGVVVTTTTDERGDYRFSLLKPAMYVLTVTAKGFDTSTTSEVEVPVGEIRRADFHLRPGTSSQVVTVHENTSEINSESGERGDVIGSEEIDHLPLNGREFLQLAELEPGAVSSNPKVGVEPSKGIDVSFNGARDGYNGYYVDGATNTDPLYNQMQSSPSLDAVAEFQVITNLYSAQYGHAGGAVISVVTKSGTNAFHGTVYEYLRNKVLDGEPYFFQGPRDTVPNYLFNQYGGTFGGPIIKNKTFFFFSTEFFHEAQPGQEIVTFAPTQQEREGNFTNSINPFSGQPVQLINPNTNQPIPGNILPSSLINPVGQLLMNLWPEPNYSGDPFLNLHLFRGSLYTQKKFLGRVDHHFSANDSITGTFDFDNYDNGTPGDDIYGDKDQVDHNKTLAVGWIHSFGSHVLNDFKASLSSFQSGTQFVLDNKNYCASWGFAPSVNTVLGTCRILFYGINYNTYNIGNDGNYQHHNDTLYIRNNLIWAKGRHTITFGAEFTRDKYKWQYDSGTSEYFFGSDDGTPGLWQYYGVSDSTFADVLMGIPDFIRVGLGGTAGPTDMHLVRNAPAAYFQDDWHVSRRLTLNLGLRYDYEAPFSDTDNELMTLDFNTGLPVYSKGAPANLLSLVQFKYETGGPNRPFTPNARNFAPRIGFAFRPFSDNRTAIRGGYGLFYISENAFNTMWDSWVSPFEGIVESYPAYAASWPDNQRHLTPVNQVPYGIPYLSGSSPGFFTPDTPHYPTSYIQQWNLTISRDLGGRWGAEIGYVGTHGVNLHGPQAVSTFDPSLLNKMEANGFSDFGLETKGFNSEYGALQATLRKDTSHGLTMLANYTWSHSLAQASNDAELENLITDVNASGNISKKVWSNADFDVPQRFTVAAVYELPFGKGKTWGDDWPGLVNGVVGGWRTNLIYTLQSGFPFTVYSSSTGYLPDRTCSGILPSSQRSTTNWFNYNCFPDHNPTNYVNPVTGVVTQIDFNGDAGINVIPGPHTNDVDFGVQKDIRLRREQMLHFRAEAFNLFNHPNLLGPSGNDFYNNSSGATITRASNTRQIQVALRYSF
jgi:hypothetical protein